MASQVPPRHPTKPPAGGPGKFSSIPTEWRLELPEAGATPDAEFGGCRSIEAGYHRGHVLGQGTYGEVYLATDLRSRDKVAAKKIKMDNEKEGFPITAIREIKILSALANAPQEINGQLLRNNVIGLREIVRSGSHKANNYKGSIYMIFDYMDHDMTGLLERTNRENRKFTAAHVKCYLRQLFSGLALLEINEVLHRDLKNANLLVNNKGELKIADFGLARYFRKGGDGSERGEPPMTQRVITLWYRPPELFLGAHKYGPEVDMWSAGCIMFELLTGKPLFPGKDEGDQLDKILSIMGQPTEASMPGCTTWDHYSMVPPSRYPARSRLRQHCESKGVTDRHALDLLEKLLALNPAARIRAQHAFMDAYFYEAPLPCKPSEMPKFETSHEMAMKRARHEGRYQQHQGYQTQQQAQRRQQGPGQGPGGYQGQQGARGGQAAQGGPPAQRQRTQGAYGQQPGRGPPGGFSGQHGRPNPHGGAEPEWNRRRR
ncbi:hypothetical protein COHA_008485 [Chlorella ohadii]|uniref:Protein kinase domain-containing protein n=1 Tax=Chlorella ohadii TaxID=2649997 RepID=A0AAD5DGM7_9CHLO|nr:hypothetical protein COHA_008485 [Chlorella ohadii]